MTVAERIDSDIIISTSPTLANQVKAIPGASFRPDDRTWRLPLSWGSCVTMRGVFGQELEVGPELVTWARSEYDNRVAPSLELRYQEDADGDERLMPHQRVGVKFLKLAERALLRDQPQLGKTAQAAIAVRELGAIALPAIVVAPNSILMKWQRELGEWADLTSSVVTGTVTQRRKALVIERDVYIINWEALRAHSRLQPFGSIRLRGCSECETGSTRKPHLCEREDRELNEMPFATIIADEVHRAKNPTAIQTRALKSAADSTRFRFGLSATPVGNSVGDLWSVMNLLAPEEWASRPKWVDRYCNKVPNWFGGVGSYDIAGLKQETTEELMRFLEPRMLGRTREQVLTHVPETMYDLRVVKMDAAQMKLYKAMKKERLVALDGELLAATNPAVANMRLVQLASSTLEMDLGTGKVFLKEPSVKVDALVELADERQGAPTVVFAESSKLIRLVSNRFEREHIKHYVIDGDEDANARDIAQQEFQTGNVPFILCTIGAGKEGLTLTAADTLVYLQQSYSYIGMSQSRDRIAGIAQVAEKVTIITYVTEGTVEENYSCVLTEKERQDLETSRDPNLWRKVIEGV